MHFNITISLQTIVFALLITLSFSKGLYESGQLATLKQELQETIRNIQTYGEPPDFEKSLSDTLLRLERSQFPQQSTSFDSLDWLPVGDVLPGRLDVCIVVSSLEGLYINSGIGTAYYSLAHLLAKHGSSVTIIYTRDEPTTSGSFSDWMNYYKSHNITLKVLPPSSKRIANPKLQSRSYRVYQHLQNSAFDIIHFADFEGLGYYSTVAKRDGLAFHNTSLVVGLHGPTRWVAHSNMNRVLLHESELEVDWMERKSVEYADAVWTPSSYLASWLSNQSWIIPENVFLLPLPPGPEVAANSEAIHNKMRASELVFFGRLETRKGLVLFCDALDLLAKMRFVKPAELRITFLGTIGYVGAKDAGSYIRARAAEWPFNVQILTHFNRSQALGYLGEQDTGRLAIIPSLADNAPYTVYECLYAGIPFIASATPSITPLLPPGKHADNLFEPKPHDLVRKLVSAVREGVSTVTPIFSVEQAERVWLSFYATLQRSHDLVAETESSPMVSVCITHFNRPNLLKQALVSIESQNYPNYEVILVDDGSTTAEADRYITSIEPYFRSKNWTIVRTRNNYLGAARNAAVQQAKGKYVLFLDDDNVAYPYQISTYANVAEKTQSHIFTSVHAIFRGVLPPDNRKIERYSVPLGASLPVGLFKNCFGDANFFVLREAFISSGGFTEEFGVGLEDHEFFAAMIFNGYKLEIIPEPLLYYRMHDVSSQMVFTSDPRLGEARRLRPYLHAFSERGLLAPEDTSATSTMSRRSMFGLVARNALNPREDCNQTLSSITPATGPVSGGTTVTIHGAGFSCGVSSIKIGNQECSGVRIVSNYELTCITPPGNNTYTPLDVTSEIAGVAVVLPASWMYTPLAAPMMTWCKLQDTGVTILCYFDSATDQSNATSCGLFSSATLTMLGAAPTCVWNNPTTVAIHLGPNATITFNDHLSTEFGAVHGQGIGGLPSQPSSVLLQKPDNAVRPVASLSAPTNIGQCEGIVLDASGSTGGAGRQLNFTWALVSISPEPLAAEKDVILEALYYATINQLSTIELANSSVAAHKTYTFSLVVNSWLAQSDVVIISVTKQEVVVPEVTISGPSLVQIYRNSPLSLQGSVTASACGEASVDPTVSYKWSVSPALSLDQNGLTSANLNVPENTLSAGTTYLFTLTVSDVDQPSIQNSASVTVVVGLRDIIARISGGNQQYAADEVVQLDGSGSSDPDDVAPLVYQWTCSSFYDVSIPCNVNMLTDSQITIDADVLGHGKWQFSLRVTSQSNNARYATSSVYVEIADSIVLSVAIEALDSNVVDPTQKLTLRGILNQANIPESEVDWNWSLVSGSLQDPDNAYSTSLSTKTLVISAGALTAGASYTYKVVATHSLSGTSGTASITFSVANSPSAGGFACPDVSGSSPETVFDFDFGSLWSSDSGITGYSLSFLPTDGTIEIPLVEPSLNRKISSRVPTGPIKVVGYVYSGNGVASRQECPLSLSYSDSSSGLQMLSNQVESASIFDIARIAYSTKNIVQRDSASDISEMRATLLQQLQSRLNGGHTTNSVTAALGALIPITDPRFGTLSYSSSLPLALSILDTLINVQSGVTLDLNTLGANVEVLGNIVAQLNNQLAPQSRSARSVMDSSEYWLVYSKVVTVSQAIAGLYMGRVDDGENAITISRNNLAVAVFRDATQNVDAQGLSIGSGNTPVLSLPAGFVPEDAAATSSLQFTYLSIGGSPYPIDTGLRLASDVVMLGVAANGQEVPLNDLHPSARLTVPMNTNDLSQLQCMWHNDSIWTTTGCETQAAGRTITCLCDHVSALAVMRLEASGAITKTTSSGLSGVWIGVIAGGAGLALAAVLVGALVVKRRRAHRRGHDNQPAPPAAPTNLDGDIATAPTTNNTVDPEAVAAAVATAASLSPNAERDDASEGSSWSSRYRARTASLASSVASPTSSYRSGCSRTSSSSSEEEIMESEIKNIANELNKQLPRDTRALEDIVNRMDME